jgi:hypothetical protein
VDENKRGRESSSPDDVEFIEKGKMGLSCPNIVCTSA